MLPSTTSPATALRRTRCASFPRSGNHLLLELLTDYFGADLRGVDIHKDPGAGLEENPCTNFEKTHDLQLDAPIDPELRHIVQVRFPPDAICSWFTQATKHNTPDTREAWKAYAVQFTPFFLRFYRKWVLKPVPNRIVVAYNDLFEYPESTLARVVEHISTEKPDRKRINDICAARSIGQRHSFATFGHFDPSFASFFFSFFSTTPEIDLANQRIETEPLKACA